MLVQESEGKNPLGRSRRRWKATIEVDVKDIWSGMDSSGSRYDQLEDSCQHSKETSGFIIGGEFVDYLNEYSFS